MEHEALHTLLSCPWGRVKPLLMGALEVEPPEREAYLNKACAGDEGLRLAVSRYLQAEPNTDFFDAHIRWDSDHEEASHTGTRIGPYLVGEKLGQGGMGSVYLASRADAVFKKQVAIKILNHEIGNAAWVKRFQKERQFLASLDHAQIVQLFDGGTTHDGLPYFVMEYIEGEDIKTYCNKRNLSLEARLKLFQKVCKAVHFAHQRLIIHRDIKPSNILVTDRGEVKLLDFGIADWMTTEGDSTTITQFRPMTPEYASPEQKSNQPVTTSSDIYALGLLFFELLTQKLPKPLRILRHRADSLKSHPKRS